MYSNYIACTLSRAGLICFRPPTVVELAGLVRAKHPRTQYISQ